MRERRNRAQRPRRHGGQRRRLRERDADRAAQPRAASVRERELPPDVVREPEVDLLGEDRRQSGLEQGRDAGRAQAREVPDRRADDRVLPVRPVEGAHVRVRAERDADHAARERGDRGLVRVAVEGRAEHGARRRPFLGDGEQRAAPSGEEEPAVLAPVEEVDDLRESRVARGRQRERVRAPRHDREFGDHRVGCSARSARKPRTARSKSAGFSRLTMWPAPGTTTFLAPFTSAAS